MNKNNDNSDLERRIADLEEKAKQRRRKLLEQQIVELEQKLGRGENTEVPVTQPEIEAKPKQGSGCGKALGIAALIIVILIFVVGILVATAWIFYTAYLFSTNGSGMIITPISTLTPWI